MLSPLSDKILLTAIGAVLIAVLMMTHLKTKEPYGLYHKKLNRRKDGQSTGTQWMNVGYWKNCTTFPEACEALATKVIESIEGTPGHILDVGHGSGDSLILHLKRSTQNTGFLRGITSNKDQFDEADRRAREACDRFARDVKLNLYFGDAIFRPLKSASAGQHPLDPTSPSPQFTAITAIDCAYHFQTREVFLQQSFARLAPGGVIALTDMALDPPQSSWRRMIARIICSVLGVPWANMISIPDYARQMEEIGFVEVEIEDITPDVFPGLSAFLKSQTQDNPKLGAPWWIMGEVFRIWWTFCGGTYVLVKAHKAS